MDINTIIRPSVGADLSRPGVGLYGRPPSLNVAAGYIVTKKMEIK
jgi:hypothetical protein